MQVRIKKLVPEAHIPAYAHATDAGMDFYAVSKEFDDHGNLVYGTGIAVEIPEGYVGLVFPRSSNSKKTLWLTNHVGVIDSGYRGEITFKYRPTIIETHPVLNFFRNLFGLGSKYEMVDCDSYEVGDKIGQLIIIPYPKVEFEEVDFLFPSDRGEGGYGSTGR